MCDSFIPLNSIFIPNIQIQHCNDDVLRAIFTHKNVWVLKRDSNPQPYDRRWSDLTIELLGLRTLLTIEPPPCSSWILGRQGHLRFFQSLAQYRLRQNYFLKKGAKLYQQLEILNNYNKPHLCPAIREPINCYPFQVLLESEHEY